MRVLITGSSGFLGDEIARQLRGAGHDTLGVDLRQGPYTDQVGDLADRVLVRALVGQADAVVHTASLHAPHVGVRSRQDFVATNVLGALHVLEAAAEAGVRRVVYTSTTSVYGEALVPTGGRAVWVTEELVPRPRDIYDITKLAAEQLCRDVARDGGLSVLCLRTGRFFPEPPNITAIHRLSRGADVRDIAAAHLLALDAATDLPYETFNIAARSPFTEVDLLALLDDASPVVQRAFPLAAEVFARRGWTLPHRIDRVYVIQKAERVLGYRPRYNFGELLRELQAGT
jgi:UDP-glucose 4-epimerase